MMTRTELRAWLRRCDAAPIPLRRAPRQRWDAAAHEAAIQEALRTGVSSLQRYREDKKTMAKVPINTNTSCPACGNFKRRAHAAHSVCVDCVSNPDEARANITRQHEIVKTHYRQALDRYNACDDALTPDERQRWDAIKAARIQVGRPGRWTNTADPVVVRKLQKTQQAIDSGDDRITEGLRNVWVADEGLFWAGEVWADAQRRQAVALAQLDDVIAALSGVQEADNAA